MKGFYWRWAASTFIGTIYQKKYCPTWDAALNRLIDKYWAEIEVGDYTATLGGTQVWIGNAFYAYGYQYGAPFEMRPSLHTMRRLDSLVHHVQAAKLEEKRKTHLKQVEGL